MNYTRGEWVVSYPPQEMPENDIGVVEMQSAELIANCYGNIANAHLIAAAPDMYEALKEATTIIHNQIRYEEGEYREHLQHKLTRFMNTLAKAEGKD